MDQTPSTTQPPEQPAPTTTTTTPPVTTNTPPPPSEPPPPPPPQSQPSTLPPTTTSPSPLQPQPPPSSLNPNPNKLPSSQPLIPISRTQFNRPPWPPNPSPFPHFSSITTTPSSITPRGGMAIGVPASPQPPSPPSSFPSPFPRPGPDSSTPQVRQSITGMQGVGMMGTLGSGSSLRPSGAAVSHPQRPIQSSLRPQIGVNNPSPAPQNFQEHGLVRHPSVGSPGSPAPTTPPNAQPHNQPWLSSGSQGKPPLAPQPFRPQMNPPSLQQRSHISPQQPSAMSPSTQQPQTTSSSLQSQPSSLSPQTQEHYTLPPSRVPQTLTHQQQMARNRGLGNQRPFAPAVGPPSSVAPQPTFNRPPTIVEPTETCNRIISKRSIHEIVSQIDPTERLDPEVEDILVDIADDFVESVTAFACSLAKHRKSNTLESKDILLHLEKNWNMSLPGFGGDEIKCYKKPFGNDVHRERVAAIKRSVAASETSILKNSGGQAGGGAKGHPAKTPALVIGSPNPKARETT